MLELSPIIKSQRPIGRSTCGKGHQHANSAHFFIHHCLYRHHFCGPEYRCHTHPVYDLGDRGSLALILFVALVAGALISYLATTPSQIKQRMTISSQRKRITEVEGQLVTSQEQLDQSQEQLNAIEKQKEAELAASSEETPAAQESKSTAES